MRKGIPVVKSVRRNAELTSFTSYTSALAHIINIIEKDYSSLLRQHMGEMGDAERGRNMVLLVMFLDSTDGACGV